LKGNFKRGDGPSDEGGEGSLDRRIYWVVLKGEIKDGSLEAGKRERSKKEGPFPQGNSLVKSRALANAKQCKGKEGGGSGRLIYDSHEPVGGANELSLLPRTNVGRRRKLK